MLKSVNLVGGAPQPSAADAAHRTKTVLPEAEPPQCHDQCHCQAEEERGALLNNMEITPGSK